MKTSRNSNTVETQIGTKDINFTNRKDFHVRVSSTYENSFNFFEYFSSILIELYAK